MHLPFLMFIVESFGHAIALSHGVIVVIVNWARAVKELFRSSIKIALSAWLLYIVDEVFWSAATWLCSPRSLWPIIMMTSMIVVAPVAVFIMSFFMEIIITMWVVIQAGSTSNVILELPIGFFRVCIRVCNLEEFVDGLGPLEVKYGAQLLMVMEFSGESGDGLTIPDVGDGVPYFREMPDVAS